MSARFSILGLQTSFDFADERFELEPSLPKVEFGCFDLRQQWYGVYRFGTFDRLSTSHFVGRPKLGRVDAFQPLNCVKSDLLAEGTRTGIEYFPQLMG